MAELRQLRYFQCVARKLSFSQAALQLNISQPALSESVRKLETELGAELLRRSRRTVELSPAGRVLLEEVDDLLPRFDSALTRTRDAARGRAGRLRVGFEATGGGQLATLARARFQRRRPDVRVEAKRYDWGGEVKALREGHCDVAFVWLPADDAGLDLQVVAEERRLVAVARDHRLADADEVSIIDLNPEPIMWTRRAPRFWVDWWAVNPRPDGSEPIWGPENENVEEMLEEVAAGGAVCIVPESMSSYYARPDLAWLPIRDVAPLRIAIGRRAGDPVELVEAFVEVVREVSAAR